VTASREGRDAKGGALTELGGLVVKCMLPEGWSGSVEVETCAPVSQVQRPQFWADRAKLKNEKGRILKISKRAYVAENARGSANASG
jgi:hypothetical protein